MSPYTADPAFPEREAELCTAAKENKLGSGVIELLPEEWGLLERQS